DAGVSTRPSPDGKYLYYRKENPKQLFRSLKSGLSEEVIYDFKDQNESINGLLPYKDNSRILLKTSSPGIPEHRFYTLDLNTKKLQRSGTIQNFAQDMTWYEPDRSLLINHQENGIENIYKFDLKTQKLTPVTSGSGPDYSPLADPSEKG